MFDTPNGSIFLEAVKSLAMATRSIAGSLQKLAALLEEKETWTKRDQLGWELFKLRYGLKMPSSDWSELGQNRNERIDACFRDADAFLNGRR